MKKNDELRKEFEKWWDENINENGVDAVWEWFEKAIQAKEEELEDYYDEIIKSSRFEE